MCALKIRWIKETWKRVLVLGIVKSCLPEMQADKRSGPKGSSLSFSRDTQSNRISARHLGMFAKDLPPDCLVYLLSFNEGLYNESLGGPTISSPGWKMTLMGICISFFFLIGSRSHQILWNRHSWGKR